YRIHRVLSMTRPFSPLFLFTAPPPTANSTLSLHDALPIYTDSVSTHQFSSAPNALQTASRSLQRIFTDSMAWAMSSVRSGQTNKDRKSTRLNSSHVSISYAVFCLKKKRDHKKGEEHSGMRK